ncbi:Translation initiation factor 2 (IF-2 GTPase) [Paramagnetospirillum magnetotacticum MS-1]|uniref:Translation initiation factor 2 (IF-2 GTPase) n=1 Tax=Paramagnetospirillum magnetotacticum MS-1 TaxID=272627 RepID=A0A0C2YIJ3_PARME|nr:phasin family protein [Paramagnetospirillum magnetotacticum]KIL99554.1 Translation initiation factor 2 (IF-2 GTPase) [Paramagnetospirillum magnetotacticum MS-1]
MPTAAFDQITTAAKANAEALTQSGNAAIAGFQELAKAYQALATKNAEKLTASIQALASVKSPEDFLSLQQKLVKEAVDAAVADSSKIAELTTTVFTAAFEPVKKQVEAAQKSAKK